MNGFDKWFEDSIGTTRCELGDGKWVEFADYLTAEEDLIIKNAALVGVQRERQVGQLNSGLSDGEAAENQTSIKIDAVRQKFARLQVYVKAWNAKTKDGKPMPCTLASFRMLHPKALAAIDDALDRHVEEMAGKAESGGAQSGAASSASADISAFPTATT